MSKNVCMPAGDEIRPCTNSSYFLAIVPLKVALLYQTNKEGSSVQQNFV